MFGAIYIGLSGLDAYSRGLQQVSNNVTNLNTTGFKGTTVSFQNYFGTGDSGGMNYTVDTRGSGNGVGLGDSQIDFKAGELRQTDRDLDLAVDGSGFLVLLDGDKMLYTRTGSFEVDKDGFIVLSGTDYRLATLDGSGHPVSLSIDSRRNSAPQVTSAIKMTGFIPTSGDPFSISDIKVYDKSGALHVWKATFTKAPAEPTIANVWTVTITDAAGTVMQAGTLKYDVGGQPTAESRTLSVTDTAAQFTVSLDFSAVQSFSGGSAPTAMVVDGYAPGTLTSITVNKTGQIELGYSNEQKVQLGAIALADFQDLQSLEQKSGGLFEYSGSGERQLLASDDPRVGQVLGKRLEASNVDLSKQFGDLILIQRGFQASSQIVSVSNDMIQQLFGIRGQG